MIVAMGGGARLLTAALRRRMGLLGRLQDVFGEVEIFLGV